MSVGTVVTLTGTGFEQLHSSNTTVLFGDIPCSLLWWVCRATVHGGRVVQQCMTGVSCNSGGCAMQQWWVSATVVGVSCNSGGCLQQWWVCLQQWWVGNSGRCVMQQWWVCHTTVVGVSCNSGGCVCNSGGWATVVGVSCNSGGCVIQQWWACLRQWWACYATVHGG